MTKHSHSHAHKQENPEHRRPHLLTEDDEGVVRHDFPAEFQNSKPFLETAKVGTPRSAGAQDHKLRNLAAAIQELTAAGPGKVTQALLQDLHNKAQDLILGVIQS